MKVTIAGRHIALHDSGGDGEAVLLVHGLGGASTFWTPVMAALNDRYRVIAPDLPCAARSDNDPEVSIASLARDLISLLDELGIIEVHLVGHSMGTIVCQHLAVAAPERVRSMALLGPLAEPPAAARTALADRAALARRDGMAPIAEAIVAGGLSPATRAAQPVAVGYVREVMLGQDPEGYALSCLALSHAQRADLSQLYRPVLCVTGADDATAPPDSVRALCAGLSDGHCEILPDCGHWTATEQPAAVATLVSEFITSARNHNPE